MLVLMVIFSGESIYTATSSLTPSYLFPSLTVLFLFFICSLGELMKIHLRKMKKTKKQLLLFLLDSYSDLLQTGEHV